MYVHDISDILIDILKMVNYLKLEGPRGAYLSEITYVATICSWAWYRLYEYPTRILRSAIYDAWVQFGQSPWSYWDFFMHRYHSYMPYWTELVVFLSLLQLMHIYWGILLAFIGYRILTESAREASRLEYEGDSGDDEGEVDAAAEGSIVADKGSGRGGSGALEGEGSTGISRQQRTRNVQPPPAARRRAAAVR